MPSHDPVRIKAIRDQLAASFGTEWSPAMKVSWFGPGRHTYRDMHRGHPGAYIILKWTSGAGPYRPYPFPRYVGKAVDLTRRLSGYAAGDNTSGTVVDEVLANYLRTCSPEAALAYHRSSPDQRREIRRSLFENDGWPFYWVIVAHTVDERQALELEGELTSRYRREGVPLWNRTPSPLDMPKRRAS